MWILPRPTSVAFSALWVVVEENEYFSLLENKTSSKAIIGTVASLFRRYPTQTTGHQPPPRGGGGGEWVASPAAWLAGRVGNAARDGLAGAAVSEPLRYRIVLRDDEHHALALAGTRLGSIQQPTPPLEYVRGLGFLSRFLFFSSSSSSRLLWAACAHPEGVFAWRLTHGCPDQTSGTR